MTDRRARLSSSDNSIPGGRVARKGAQAIDAVKDVMDRAIIEAVRTSVESVAGPKEQVAGTRTGSCTGTACSQVGWRQQKRQVRVDKRTQPIYRANKAHK